MTPAPQAVLEAWRLLSQMWALGSPRRGAGSQQDSVWGRARAAWSPRAWEGLRRGVSGWSPDSGFRPLPPDAPVRCSHGGPWSSPPTPRRRVQPGGLPPGKGRGEHGAGGHSAPLQRAGAPPPSLWLVKGAVNPVWVQSAPCKWPPAIMTSAAVPSALWREQAGRGRQPRHPRPATQGCGGTAHPLWVRPLQEPRV